MTAAVVGLALVVLLLGVLVAGVLRSHAEILKALHELGAGLELDRTGPATVDGIPAASAAARRAGTAVDTLVGTTLDGETVAYSLASGPTLLAFLSSGCTTCATFWSAFRTGSPTVPAQARLLVVVRDLAEESERDLKGLRPAAVPVVVSTSGWDAFGVPGSPYFVLVQDGRVVGEGSGASWAQVATLLSTASADAAVPSPGGVRDARDSAALRAAGVGPGHPSLFEAP